MAKPVFHDQCSPTLPCFIVEAWERCHLPKVTASIKVLPLYSISQQQTWKNKAETCRLRCIRKEKTICIWPERLSAFGLKDFLYWARKTSLICHKHK